jgi:hypothetical protein
MVKRDVRWYVKPGDAVGLAIRIPIEHIEPVLALFNPVITRSSITPPDNYPTIYVTIGHGTLNNRPTPHRLVNVICEPPPWVSVTPPAIGCLAWVGAPSNPVNQLFWRQGYGRIEGRLSLHIDDDHLHARARIATNGGVLQVIATVANEGEAWNALPNQFINMNPDIPAYCRGDEWGVRHDGSGTVSFQWNDGMQEIVDTYVGLDMELGWDYVLSPTGPHAR